MDKYISRWTLNNSNSNIESSSSNRANTNDNNNAKRVRVELSEDGIIGDPANRKSINSYPVKIRDELRRRYVTRGPCQPLDHAFPQTCFSGKLRRFQSKWFEQYCWLEYSVSKDAGFCFWCYLFASDGHKHGDIAFTEVGFKNWKKAIEKFKEHEGKSNSAHDAAKIRYIGFRDQKHNIDYMLAKRTKEMEVDYRTRLTAIVDVIRLILRQDLPFRGHDESTDSLARGNFLEILQFLCEPKEVNKVMNLNAPGNNQLTSPKIQKEIICACATEVKQVILNEIGKKRFSLLIDEARDSSVKEQMAVIFRFVNDHGEVIERFFGLVHVMDTSVQSLKNVIDDLFAKNGLSLSSLRGQGYNGASNMRGEFNGLKALILKENKHAHYIHCFAHQLQLVIVFVASEHRVVSSFVNYLSMIVNICGASCKRKDALLLHQHEKMVELLETGEISTGKGKNQETNLARPGDTRWGSHHKTIFRLLHMWNSVQKVLTTVCSEGTEVANRGSAYSMLQKMNDFEFVFLAHFLEKILELTSVLSQALQRKDENIENVIHLIGILKMKLQKYRSDGWEELLEQVVMFCSKHDVPVPNMEDVMLGRVRIRIDDGPKTYLHHFRVEIFLQVLDLISQEMDNRFNESNSELLICIGCLNPSDSFANFDNGQLLRLAKFYSEDFSEFEVSKLSHELDFFIHDARENVKFVGLEDIGALAKRMVDMKYDALYPLVYRLVELALILPVATATVGRVFSGMNFVKNDLRNRMGDEFLTDSLVCYIEKEIFAKIENEVILQRFQNMGTRRIQLSSRVSESDPSISNKI